MKTYGARDFKVGEMLIIRKKCEFVDQYAVVSEAGKDGWISAKTPGMYKPMNFIPSHGEVEKL